MSATPPVPTFNSSETLSVPGTLFAGIRFLVTHRTPQRSRYVTHIKNNGGESVVMEKNADVVIADHLRRDNPDRAISYTWIEKSLKTGRREPWDGHRASPATRQPRAVGDVRPGKATRNPYTHEDDAFLYKWVQDYIDGGGRDWKGNQLYIQLEQANSRHPYQSWRDRYIKYVQFKPPINAAAPVAVPVHDSMPSVAPGAITEGREQSKDARSAQPVDGTSTQQTKPTTQTEDSLPQEQGPKTPHVVAQTTTVLNEGVVTVEGPESDVHDLSSSAVSASMALINDNSISSSQPQLRLPSMVDDDLLFLRADGSEEPISSTAPELKMFEKPPSNKKRKSLSPLKRRTERSESPQVVSHRRIDPTWRPRSLLDQPKQPKGQLSQRLSESSSQVAVKAELQSPSPRLTLHNRDVERVSGSPLFLPRGLVHAPESPSHNSTIEKPALEEQADILINQASLPTFGNPVAGSGEHEINASIDYSNDSAPPSDPPPMGGEGLQGEGDNTDAGILVADDEDYLRQSIPATETVAHQTATETELHNETEHFRIETRPLDEISVIQPVETPQNQTVTDPVTLTPNNMGLSLGDVQVHADESSHLSVDSSVAPQKSSPRPVTSGWSLKRRRSSIPAQGQRLSLSNADLALDHVDVSSFTEEEKDMLFTVSENIQRVTVGNYNAMWREFAQSEFGPGHSAAEWKTFYEQEILPIIEIEEGYQAASERLATSLPPPLDRQTVVQKMVAHSQGQLEASDPTRAEKAPSQPTPVTQGPQAATNSPQQGNTPRKRRRVETEGDQDGQFAIFEYQEVDDNDQENINVQRPPEHPYRNAGQALQFTDEGTHFRLEPTNVHEDEGQYPNEGENDDEEGIGLMERPSFDKIQQEQGFPDSDATNYLFQTVFDGPPATYSQVVKPTRHMQNMLEDESIQLSDDDEIEARAVPGTTSAVLSSPRRGESPSQTGARDGNEGFVEFDVASLAGDPARNATSASPQTPRHRQPSMPRNDRSPSPIVIDSDSGSEAAFEAVPVQNHRQVSPPEDHVDIDYEIPAPPEFEDNSPHGQAHPRVDRASGSSISTSQTPAKSPRTLPWQQNIHSMNTQALLDSETQHLDFTIPGPPEDDENEEEEDDDDQDDASTPSSEALIHPPSPNRPTSSNTQDTDNYIERFIEDQERRGFSFQQTKFALQRTTLDLDLALAVLESFAAGNGLPRNIPGVWTQEEDRVLQSGNAVEIKKLEARHGKAAFDARIEALDELPTHDSDE